MHPELIALDLLITIGRVGAWILSNPDEACGAFAGLVGAFLLAGNGKHARWGWLAFLASNACLIAFALRYGHPGLLALQLGFTCTTARGIWLWIIKPQLWWHEWRGDLDGTNVVMHIMHLVRTGDGAGDAVLRIRWLPAGWSLDLHKMVGADSPGCYHTHPAKAWRLVLWGGYIEELEDCTRVRCWWPGRFGIVQPELSHLIAALPHGTSYSLWLRGPKTHDIQLRGPGWSAPARFTGAGDRSRDLSGELARIAGAIPDFAGIAAGVKWPRSEVQPGEDGCAHCGGTGNLLAGDPRGRMVPCECVDPSVGVVTLK